MSTGLTSFLKQSADSNQKNLAAFRQVACKLAAGEDLAPKAIKDACGNAGKSADDLVDEIDVARELLDCVAAIEAEASDTESKQFWDALISARVARADEVATVKQLIVALEVAHRRSINAEGEHKAKTKEQRELADDAERRLHEVDAASYGIEIPARARFKIPSTGYQAAIAYGWGEDALRRDINSRFEDDRKQRVQSSIDVPVLPPLSDAELQYLNSGEFLEKLKSSSYATLLLRSLLSEAESVAAELPAAAPLVPIPVASKAISEESDDALDPTSLDE